MNTEGNAAANLNSLFKAASTKGLKKQITLNLAWVLAVLPLAGVLLFRKRLFALKNLLPKKNI